MKFKLHNKFEITLNNKTITAYNTLLHKVYEKIANLESYNTRIAIGNGSDEIEYSASKLSNYINSFPASTEDICSDPTKETLYVKKLVTFDENDTSSFSFCELGLCTSDAQNPDIYNHVLLKDNEGNVVTVTKNPGDVLQIRVTIYLELTTQSTVGFYAGDNTFIKQILGEDLGITDKNIYAVRGEFLAENSNLIYRPTPEITDSATKCTTSFSEDESGTVTIRIIGKLNHKATEELILIYANQIIFRLNTTGILEPSNIEKIIPINDDHVSEIDTNIKSITTILRGFSNYTNNVNIRKYGTKITDKDTNLFNQTFTSENTRILSLDGQKIAFVKDSQTFLYEIKNNRFIQIYGTLPSSFINMTIANDKIICVLSENPYIKIYEITNGELQEKQVSLGNFSLTSFSYSWKAAQSVISDNGTIMVGIIENNAASTPFVLKFTKNTSGVYVDELVRIGTDKADKVFAIYNSCFATNKLVFLSSNYNNMSIYSMEAVDDSGNNFVSTSAQAYTLLNNSEKIVTGGRIILSCKAQENESKILYNDSYNSITSDIDLYGKYYLSYDGDYLIQIKDGNNKIFNVHRKDVLTEFESGYENLIDFNSAVDFEFIGDKILVFTNNQTCPIYSVEIKKNKTRLDNLNNDLTITAKYLKYNIIGEAEDQGVKIEISLTFN